MAFKVMSRPCATCIFGNNSPISPARFEELKTTWAADDIVQECHVATIKHEHIGCKGHYNAARRGEIPHPITSIAATMGMVGVKVDDLMQIYERLGLIIFVDIEEGK